MSLQFYQHLLQVLYQGNAVVATVVKAYGSVPREIGAKMMLCADRERLYRLYTIGGGAGEAKVLKAMEKVLETGEAQAVAIDLSGRSNRTIEGVCGGKMQVWIQRWSPDAIALTESIVDTLQNGRSLLLFTPFSSASFPYLLPEHTTQFSDEEGLTECLEPPPLLLIIGAGHVGEQLATVGDFLGFQVIIQDDRREWANAQRFPRALHIFNAPISEVLDQVRDRHSLYVAMVTRGYTYDVEILTELFQSELDYQYVGMIGSQKRVKQVKETLRNQNISSEKLHSLYAPIGLDIGALTPEEIAISIGAELVLVQRGGMGYPLSRQDNP